MLIENAHIADQDLPIAAFQAHLQMGSAVDPDGLQTSVLAGFLRAAIAAIEGQTGQVLLARLFEWHPARVATRYVLPVRPVQNVTQVDQIDAQGNAQVVDRKWYHIDKTNAEPVLVFSGSAAPKGGSISVYFTAGIAQSWDQLPADLAQAVLMLAAHYYEFRHDTGLSQGCMPFGVTSLIQRFRVMRLGAPMGAV